MRLIWIENEGIKPVAYVGTKRLGRDIEIEFKVDEPTTIRIDGFRVTEPTRVVFRGTLIAYDKGLDE